MSTTGARWFVWRASRAPGDAALLMELACGYRSALVTLAAVIGCDSQQLYAALVRSELDRMFAAATRALNLR